MPSRLSRPLRDGTAASAGPTTRCALAQVAIAVERLRRLPLALRPRPRRVVVALRVLLRRRPDVLFVADFLLFAAVVEAVRRPPRRLLVFEPMF